MGRKKSTAGGDPQSIRIPEALAAAVTEASLALGMSEHDVMRLAMKVGIEDLRRIEWNLEGAVVDKAKPSFSQTTGRTHMATSALLAEPTASYGSSEKKKRKVS